MTLFQIFNVVTVSNSDYKFAYLVGVGSGLGAVTVDLRDLLVLAGDLGLAAEAVLAGLFFLAGLRPLDLDLDGVAFLAVLSSAMDRFLTSLALMVKMVPSSYCTSYSLSSSRTKFTLAWRKKQKMLN